MTAVIDTICKNTRCYLLANLMKVYSSLFPAVDLNGFRDEFAGARAAAGVDVLGEFAAGGIGVAEAEKDLVGTGVHVLSDEGLDLFYDILCFV